MSIFFRDCVKRAGLQRVYDAIKAPTDVYEYVKGTTTYEDGSVIASVGIYKNGVFDGSDGAKISLSKNYKNLHKINMSTKYISSFEEFKRGVISGAISFCVYESAVDTQVTVSYFVSGDHNDIGCLLDVPTTVAPFTDYHHIKGIEKFRRTISATYWIIT